MKVVGKQALIRHGQRRIGVNAPGSIRPSSHLLIEFYPNVFGGEQVSLGDRFGWVKDRRIV